VKTPLEVLQQIADMGCVYEVRCDKVIPDDHPCQGCVAREYLESVNSPEDSSLMDDLAL